MRYIYHYHQQYFYMPEDSFLLNLSSDMHLKKLLLVVLILEVQRLFSYIIWLQFAT